MALPKARMQRVHFIPKLVGEIDAATADAEIASLEVAPVVGSGGAEPVLTHSTIVPPSASRRRGTRRSADLGRPPRLPSPAPPRAARGGPGRGSAPRPT